jgi:hypothetical protein
MSDTKYLSVVHTQTKKIVTAFQFENDATWIGKEKDELIATANYCEIGQEVKMIFVKSYKKNDGKFIHPYFRSAPNQTSLKNNMSGESDKHRMSKQNIYDGIYSGNIKINGQPIDKEKVDDIYIEYRTSKSGYVIPDVLIKFKEEDIKYGLGIFIEIQLSKQYQEETLIRTYSRVIEGFSGIWIWEDDLDKECNLINKNLQVKPHRQLLSELDSKMENNFISRINKYGEIIDKKINKFEEEVIDISFENIKNVRNDADSYKNELLIEKRNLTELKEISNKLDTATYKLNVNHLANNINKGIERGVSLLEKSMQEKTNELVRNSLSQSIDKMNRMCPKCNKPMKIGKSMSGYNWYCQDFPLKCDGLIKDVCFNEN